MGNPAGDTVKVAQVTERDRLRDRTAVKDKEEKLVVRTDTVYVERKDSVVVKEANVSHQTSFISHLLKQQAVYLLFLRKYAFFCLFGVSKHPIPLSPSLPHHTIPWGDTPEVNPNVRLMHPAFLRPFGSKRQSRVPPRPPT